MSDTPRKAEHVLADEGVFAGHVGLRGLHQAREFWAAQMYGTRLYYGGGLTDYLHHGVLGAAISALDKMGELKAELAAAQERVRELEARLEIVPGHPYDGIDCRDETIRLADERIRELRENGTRLVEAADGWKIRCQAEEIIRVRVEAERDALREDAGRYRQERDHERARRERVTQLLLAIHARLSSPAPIESDGRTYIFDPIDKTMYWEVHQQLCELIRKIPQELDAALDARRKG